MRKMIKRPGAESGPNATREYIDAALKRHAEATATEGGAQPATIRHGVKTDRDTQPVQVRMLKSQIQVLKQIAAQEGRSSSDVVRELVDNYIMECLESWEDSDARTILEATIRQTGYYEDLSALGSNGLK